MLVSSDKDGGVNLGIRHISPFLKKLVASFTTEACHALLNYSFA